MRHAHATTVVLALALAGCPQQAPQATAPDAPAPASNTTPAPPPPIADMNPTESAAPQGKRAAGEENAPLQAWRGFGTEPFWEARVDGDTLVFSTPDNQAGRSMQGRRVPSLVGYVFVGKDGDQDFNLGLTPGECSDGMSDNRYDFKATFTYGGATYTGCGEAAK